MVRNVFIFTIYSVSLGVLQGFKKKQGPLNKLFKLSNNLCLPFNNISADENKINYAVIGNNIFESKKISSLCTESSYFRCQQIITKTIVFQAVV
jgi:hypothetical protein